MAIIILPPSSTAIDLQSTINNASFGDTIGISSDIMFTENVVIPADSSLTNIGNNWVLIQNFSDRKHLMANDSLMFPICATTAHISEDVQIIPFATQMVAPPSTPDEQVTDWGELQAAVTNAAGASVDIQVMNNITADFGAITIPANTTVYLRSNPAAGATFSIYQDTADARHFFVNGGLSLGDIQLTRTIPTGLGINGGGIDVWSGQLEMFTGSVISGNEAASGGGISVENGTLDMHGGIISNNMSAGDGGGVRVMGGTFIMYDGEISGNTSFEMGGGVCITESSIFIMHGGTISGNKAETSSGGGVAVSSSSFVMSDSTISDNTALSVHGGGIYIRDGSFTMTSGTIINNTTLWMHGGGIYNGWDGSVTILGGAIVNNTAPHGSGGGIFTIFYDSLTIDPDAIFIGNTANSSHDWFLSPSFLIDPVNVPAGESGWGQGGSIANIGWYSTSIAGAHLLNNYDINFNGAPITYQVVNFNPNGGAFADTALSQIQANGQSQWRWISQIADTGVTNPPPTYALAFDAAGNLLNLPLPHPTRSGYIFGGWFDTQANADGTTQVGRVLHTDNVTSDANRTLWARWEAIPPNYYEILYNANGGVGGHYDIVQSGTEYTILTSNAANISRASYTFISWNIQQDGSGTTYMPGETIIITGSLTLYAQWEPAREKNDCCLIILLFLLMKCRPKKKCCCKGCCICH